MTSLPYLLTVSLYMLLFYGCYWLLVRRNTFFGLNRAYLLTSVMLSLLLPLVKLPGETVESLPIGSITLPTFVAGSTTTTENNAWSLTNWLWLMYGLGAAVMLVRLSLNLWTVFQLIRQGTAEPKSTYILVRLPQELTPEGRTPSFSFGRYLVLNHTDALTESAALLRHEEAHIRQYHTADILFLEIVQVAFWFNPVVRFYKRALQEVHEFLADRAVLKTPQPDYAHQLVAYALNVSPSALITPFVSKSTLKQRIVMLQKPQTHRRALLGYALALPLAALLVMCTQPDRDLSQADKPGTETTIHANQSARQANVDGEIFTVVENQPEFQGGMKELGAYLQKNLRYPASAQKANAQGRVFISFIVTKTGEIADVKLLKGIGFGADEEAIRVVQSMPHWKPATQNGQVVNVRYNLPINFQLEDKDWETLKKVSPPPPAPAVKKSAFFSVPTDDADIQKAFKHFVVNGEEVSFNDFRKHSKADIVEVSSNQQSIRIETK